MTGAWSSERSTVLSLASWIFVISEKTIEPRRTLAYFERSVQEFVEVA